MSLVLEDFHVEGLFTGITFRTRAAVAVATTTAGTLATSFANGSVVDGYTLVTGDRILIKDQANATENGIYDVQVAGAPIRSDDMQAGDSIAAVQIPILNGTVNGGSVYICKNTSGSDVVGTNNISYVVGSIGGSILPVDQGGTGVSTLTANRFLVGNGTSTVDLNKVVPTGTVVGTSDTQTLTNKTLTTPVISSDATKHITYNTGGNTLLFNVVDQTVGSSTLNLPNLAGTTDTVVTTALAQTLTNKTLTIPIINTDNTKHTTYNTGINPLLFNVVDQTVGTSTLNVPDLASTTDTVVTTALAQTLTNKTLVADNTNLKDNTSGNLLNFSLSSLTTNRVLTVPDETGTIATQAYVDSVAQGLVVKDAVRVATTANITISSGPASIDGVTINSGDRVLVKDQTTGSENGIYQWNGIGSALTRTSDFDTSADAISGSFMFVQEGTVNKDSGWVLTTDPPINLGTTPLTFTQFSGAGQITAGLGLSKTGNTLDVNLLPNGGLIFNGDNIQVDLAATSITGTLPITQGGTGLTSLTSNKFLIGNGTALDLTKDAPTGVVVGTTDTQTLTNKTLTSPVINQIVDSNGNPLMIYTSTASAVNEVSVGNATTGNAPQLAATGTDTNISLSLSAKGTGVIQLQGTSTAPATLDFYEQTSNGTNKVSLVAPAAIASNVSFTLPTADGTAGYHMKTDGAGNLGFERPPLNRLCYQLSSFKANIKDNWKKLSSSWFAWNQSRYSVYSSGTCVIYVQDNGTNDAIRVQLRNFTTPGLLGSVDTTAGVDSSYTFTFTLPTADANLFIRAKRLTANGGTTYPILAGVQLEFAITI